MPQDPTGKTHQDVTQTSSQLPGFKNVKRSSGSNAAKQIQGYEGPAERGSASSRESYRNASFDKSLYQDLGSDSSGWRKPTGAPIGSDPGNKFTKQPYNKSNSKEVGDCPAM
jgi:hypothetical protein